MSDDYLWRAAGDGIRHARRPGFPRTLCGELVIPERLAWPKRRDCADCAALAAPRVVRVGTRQGALR